MTETDTEWANFTNALLAAGLWLPTGIPGVYGRNDVFEGVATAFERLITTRSAADGASRVFYPPGSADLHLFFALLNEAPVFPNACPRRSITGRGGFCWNGSSRASRVPTFSAPASRAARFVFDHRRCGAA